MNDELIKTLGLLSTEKMEVLIRTKNEELSNLQENLLSLLFQVDHAEALINALQKEVYSRYEDDEINVFIDEEEEKPSETFNPFEDEGMTDEKMELLLKLNKLQSEVETFLRKGAR